MDVDLLKSFFSDGIQERKLQLLLNGNSNYIVPLMPFY